MIRYGKNDYLIVCVDGKNHFGSVMSKGNLLLEKGIEKDETTEQLSFKKKDVVANLGTNPIRGKTVYGITINPFLRSEIHPRFGQMNFYTDVDQKDEERLVKRMNKIWKTLKDNKCIAAYPLTSINLYAGKKNPFVYSQKLTKEQDVVRNVNLFLQDYKDKDYVDHTLASIAARAVWANQVPEDIQLRWTKLYHKYLTLKTLDQKQINSILDSINEYFQETENATISSYQKERCDEEDIIVLKAILRHINQIHKINVKKLDRLFMREPEFASKLFPTQVEMSLPKATVSLAAEKSVEDLFCECMAFHFRGVKLSKTFRKYVKLTLEGLSKKFAE